MLKKTPLLIAVAISLAGFCAAEDVELTGTFQVRIGCADTHHEETPMLVVPGKDKFSGESYALKLDMESKKKLRIGQTFTIQGKKQKASTKKMTKAQVRQAVVQHAEHGEGLPINCENIGQIISKIQINKPDQAAAVAHDHGKLQLKQVDDDHEVVDVHIMEHIEVTHIQAAN